MSADQVLHRGAALEFECLGDGGAGGGRQILARGLGTTPGVGQRVAELPPQRTVLVSRERPKLERESVKLHGAVEGQRLGGLLGCPGEVFARLRWLVGPQEVGAQVLEIGLPRGLEGQTEPPMQRLQDLRRQMRHDGLPDPVVIGLDRPLFGRPRPANQPGRAEQRQRRALVTGQLGALARVGLADRPAGDRDDLQEPPRLVREPDDPIPEDLVERDLGALDGRSDASAPAWIDRTSSATKKGLPPDSRAIASACDAAHGSSRSSSASARLRASAGVRASTASSRRSRLASTKPCGCNRARTNGLVSTSSDR